MKGEDKCAVLGAAPGPERLLVNVYYHNLQAWEARLLNWPLGIRRKPRMWW